MKVIAMIPARMGSKRVPLKNIRILNGKPLIAYPIDLAKKSKQFDEIWINTESEPLGHYAEKLGINFYKRPKELSSDTATNREFMYDFLKSHECDYVVMINPTSPLLSDSTLTAAIKLAMSNEYDTLLSVVPEKTECFYLGKEINFDIQKKINSQYLEPVYRTVWAITIWRRKTFIENQEHKINPIFGGRIGYIPIPKYESCDIDTEEDWIVAERSISSAELKKPSYLDLKQVFE